MDFYQWSGKLVSEIPPNPPLEKGGEGGISGIAWLEKETFGTGLLLSYRSVFPFLFPLQQ
jgi:hypothetical protein